MPYRRATPAGMPRGYIPQEPTLLWGSIPVDELEGHEPDPAYDVRRSSDGLGSTLPMSTDMLGRRRERRGRRFSTEDFSGRGAAVLSEPGSAPFDRVQETADGTTTEGVGFEAADMLVSLLVLGVLLRLWRSDV